MISMVTNSNCNMYYLTFGSYFIDKFANTDISLDIISREKPTNLIDSNVEMYHIDKGRVTE